jgi:hypothetical protein
MMVRECMGTHYVLFWIVVVPASYPKFMEHVTIDVSYAALQAHRIVIVTLHREYSPGIVFIFSQV